MKNQYFGDKRDFFKYQLIESMATRISDIRQLTCIWMLTLPAPSNDGNRQFIVHPGSERLGQFLQDCVASGQRDVRQLTRYFAGASFRYFSYGDSADRYFRRSSRPEYFNSIPSAALRDAVVFLDPDNGMEPQRVLTPSHLRYSELASVFGRMDDNSVVVLYQHLPRRKALEFWPEVGGRIAASLHARVYYVADRDVAFYIVPKHPRRERLIEGFLPAFSKGWPRNLQIGGPLRG